MQRDVVLAIAQRRGALTRLLAERFYVCLVSVGLGKSNTGMRSRDLDEVICRLFLACISAQRMMCSVASVASVTHQRRIFIRIIVFYSRTKVQAQDL